jgi:hypothetical protein
MLRPRIAPPQPVASAGYGLPIDEEIASFGAAAMRQATVDAYVTELVRLFCAGHHDCRHCRSLRLLDAGSLGLDEGVVGKIPDYKRSDLDPRSKAALAFAEAMVTRPASLDAEACRELRSHFSDEQIAELAFDIVKWSRQKVLVALRLDGPASDELIGLRFDAVGNGQLEER